MLSVIGGILGILIASITFLFLASLSAFLKGFSGNAPPDAESIFGQMLLAIILYVVAIVLPFVMKNTRMLGWLLIGISVVTLISISFFGIVGFALLLPAGIIAIRWKNRSTETEHNEKSQNENAFDILKTRYAKGEITKEQFDEMKKEFT